MQGNATILMHFLWIQFVPLTQQDNLTASSGERSQILVQNQEKRCASGDNYGQNYYHMTQASVSADAFSLLWETGSQGTPGFLLFYQPKTYRLNPFPGATINIFIASTSPSTVLTTAPLISLYLGVKKERRCLKDGGWVERTEFQRNPQSLGATWPGGGSGPWKRDGEWLPSQDSLAGHPEPFYLSRIITQLHLARGGEAVPIERGKTSNNGRESGTNPEAWTETPWPAKNDSSWFLHEETSEAVVRRYILSPLKRLKGGKTEEKALP